MKPFSEMLAQIEAVDPNEIYNLFGSGAREALLEAVRRAALSATQATKPQIMTFPGEKKPTPLPGERLHHILLELVRMCVLDNIGHTSICMEDVVIDGQNTGTWILDLRKGDLAPYWPRKKTAKV